MVGSPTVTVLAACGTVFKLTLSARYPQFTASARSQAALTALFLPPD